MIILKINIKKKQADKKNQENIRCRKKEPALLLASWVQSTSVCI